MLQRTTCLTKKLTQKNIFKFSFQQLKQYFQNEPNTQNELLHVLRHAQNRSLIDAETLSMIEGVMLFATMRVRDIMLPKNQMICIPHNATLAEVIHLVTDSGHSRFPVLGNSVFKRRWECAFFPGACARPRYQFYPRHRS